MKLKLNPLGPETPPRAEGGFKVLLLAGAVLALALQPAPAAADGSILGGGQVEIQGKALPLGYAQVVLLNETPDLEAVEILARRAAAKDRQPERAYHQHRAFYLIRAIEDGRRLGVSQVRTAVLSKKTDGRGAFNLRYLKPGTYYLGVYRTFRNRDIAVWLLPVQVAEGRVTQVSLDNTNAFEVYWPNRYPATAAPAAPALPKPEPAPETKTETEAKPPAAPEAAPTATP
ncbi:MAG TPA: hypothetical protein PKN80_03120 [bacterium]|uniref:Uncharacterized protein n=1 Tax=candidate division TA06 bacterium ADurb.Bin417 TaxID=1852828 RepID=A0A1V5MJZ0_UNCT6|nr:MAG: hypothetical protein BWY73_00463 [candidate division TA06 bacterium ADurb.Bin417]HNQ35037.1 hypothetical protein [bacterium]HNS49183.1 hypothetical protein [bacterium]